MIDRLTFIYNRARQAAITTELMEIIDGLLAPERDVQRTRQVHVRLGLIDLAAKVPGRKRRRHAHVGIGRRPVAANVVPGKRSVGA